MIEFFWKCGYGCCEWLIDNGNKLARIFSLFDLERTLEAMAAQPFDRDSPDGSSESPIMVAQWASELESGSGLSR